MANIRKLNKTRLKEIKAKCQRSFYYFQAGPWGDPDLYPPVHRPLCDWLQEGHLRAMMCMWRGSLKSSSIRAYLAWRGLHEVNWSSLWICQKFDLAKNQLRFVSDKFMIGQTSGLLQELYWKRLNGFEGWTREQILFTKTDPNAHPFLSVAGLESRLESLHVDLIVGDDLEGADAEKSDAPNDDSEDFVLNRSVPLLKKPGSCGVLISGTPHGNSPLVWKMRRLADEMSEKSPGNPLNWSYFWKEVMDSAGKSRWPERFPEDHLTALQIAASMSKRAKVLWDKQYMLREKSAGAGFFDVDEIRSGFFTLKKGRLVSYPDKEQEGKVLDAAGFPIELEPVLKTVDMAYLRFYIHMDPLHKDPEDRLHKQESMWAIMVVGVAPNFHSFVFESWIKDASFEDALRQFFLLYRRYAPYRVTIDPVGAQTWIKHYMRLAERTTHRKIVALPAPWRDRPRRLPAPSSITEEAMKQNTEKETWILNQLDLQFSMGWLHLRQEQEVLLNQLANVGTGSGFIDGPDALSQGPTVWEPPVSRDAIQAMKKRRRVLDLMGMVEPITGYVRRFKEGRSSATI